MHEKDVEKEPQADERGLLTDEEIDEITAATFKASGNVPCDYVIAGAKAQLSADNARWQRKVEEIEPKFKDLADAICACHNLHIVPNSKVIDSLFLLGQALSAIEIPQGGGE